MSKAVAWLLGWMLLAALDPLPAQTVTAPQYLDSRTPIEQRLDDLITRMTTAEKIDQSLINGVPEACPVSTYPQC